MSQQEQLQALVQFLEEHQAQGQPVHPMEIFRNIGRVAARAYADMLVARARQLYPGA